MSTILPASFLQDNTTSTSSSLAPKDKAEEQKSQFLTLLVAQLKGQNPLDPKDGTEFISQLTQFSSLEELINIRTALETTAATTADASAAAAAAAATSSTNPFSGSSK